MWTFLQALPADLQRQLHQTAELVDNVHTAITAHGWTPTGLAHEAARNHAGANNPAALVIHRLRIAATRPPPRHAATGPPIVPFCSEECRNNAGWRLDHDGRPVDKCPCRTPREDTRRVEQRSATVHQGA